MKRVRLSIQIALCLSLLSATVIFAAKGLGLLPNPRQTEIESRIKLCENLAVTSSVLANRDQWEGISLLLTELKNRNDSVVSAGLRRLDDRLLAEIGNHGRTWQHTPQRLSTETHVYVPILQGKGRWGSLEVNFRTMEAGGLPAWIDVGTWQLVIFVASANALMFRVYLGRVLYELDPSRVMPKRVRSAFDTLSEGLLVLDGAGRIVLANQALASALGRKPEDLLGVPASVLPFQDVGNGGVRPWEAARDASAGPCGVEMSLTLGSDVPKTFFVNSAPIEDQQGKNLRRAHQLRRHHAARTEEARAVANAGSLARFARQDSRTKR